MKKIEITKFKDDNGRLHNDFGPAYIGANYIEYFKHGLLHRLDGPAVIWTHGYNNEWWINGRGVTDEIYKWTKEMNIDLANLTDEDKIMIRLYWENYDGK